MANKQARAVSAVRAREIVRIFDEAFAELSDEAQEDIDTILRAFMDGIKDRETGKAMGFGVTSAKELLVALIFNNYLPMRKEEEINYGRNLYRYR